MNCSCNLYSLKKREADRKTGNYTKEFIPRVVIKICFKNAHYKHLVRQYIHSRSQFVGSTGSGPCRVGCTLHGAGWGVARQPPPWADAFSLLRPIPLTLLSLPEPRKGLRPKHSSLNFSLKQSDLDKSLFRRPK